VFFIALALGLSLVGRAQRSTTRLARLPAVPVTQTGPARYAQLDQVAKQLTETHATTLDKLAAALAAYAHSDEDKARLVFAWIAYHVAYDVAYLQGSGVPHVTAEQALTSRLAICQGYAELLTALASRMQLTAATVEGYATVDSNSPTSPVLGADRGHTWNVYRTNSGVHIVDTCWGAGNVSDDYAKFKQHFTPYWFNTPPEQAIFMH
jgi:transglutaminase/protease-like cytokinesis protein 3